MATTNTSHYTTVARLALVNMVLRFGPPNVVMSDRGSRFVNEVIDCLLDLFLVHKVVSSGYRPQTQGVTERHIQAHIDYTAMYCDRNQRNWDELAPFADYMHT